MLHIYLNEKLKASSFIISFFVVMPYFYIDVTGTLFFFYPRVLNHANYVSCSLKLFHCIDKHKLDMCVALFIEEVIKLLENVLKYHCFTFCIIYPSLIYVFWYIIYPSLIYVFWYIQTFLQDISVNNNGLGKNHNRSFWHLIITIFYSNKWQA